MFSLFRLKDDFTKRYGYFCDKHDKEIAKTNLALLKMFPNKTWEVK